MPEAPQRSESSAATADAIRLASAPSLGKPRRRRVGKTLADGEEKSTTLTRTMAYSVAKLRDRPPENPGPTIESAILALHAKSLSCADLEWRTGDDEQTSMWLNSVLDRNTSVSGMIVVINGSTHQQHVDLDLSQKEVRIEAMPAPTGKSWARGAVFFFARDNHLITIQSQMARASTLRNYLNVMLRKHGIIAENEEYMLVPPASREFVQAMKGIKQIRLAPAPPPPKPRRAKHPSEDATRSERDLVIEGIDPRLMPRMQRAVVNVLREYVAPGRLDALLDAKALKIELSLRPKPMRERETAEALQNFVGDLLNITDGDPTALQLDVYSGSTQIRRNMVVVKAPVTLNQDDVSRMPVLAEVHEEAARWLTQLTRTHQGET